ncbi:beta strand repeat-containing protein, partial [Inquilinus sp. CA228]|uniref:beta strand repeat-containing protein n=1 Tax=Inquilinus sp. CA228 TaxID=3455609 RepID=UPI003F8D0E29
STVSVGDAGAERTITNVAAGRLSATSTDAVNGSQLFATNTAVDDVASQITDVTGQLTHYYSVNDGGTQGANYDNDGATGTNSLAAGVAASATAADATALGANSSATNAGDVALGSGSATAAAVGTASATIAGTTYSFAGTTPASAVSVGAAGAERTITNVAAGRIAIDSTEAVNGSQLFATNTSVDTLNTKVDNISTGGGIKYFHATSTLADSQATGTDSTAAGPEAVASVTDGVAVGHGATAGANAGDVALGSGSTTAAVVGTASATIAGTTYAFAGTTPTSTVSVGAPGAERTITNVAAGRIAGDSTDAVNGSQLFATNTAVDSVANEVTTITGQLTHYYSVNDGGTQGANYDNDGATGTNSVAAGVGASATAADATVLGANASAGNAGDVALGSGSVTAAAVGTASATIAGTTYSFAGTAPASTVSVGSAGAERTITNVAAGRLSATSTDAVNGSQLFASNQAIDNVASQITDVNGQLTHYYSVNDGGTQGSNYDNRGATGTNSLAAGVGASATAANATAVGNGSQALAASTVAIGDTTTVAAAAGTGSVAIGHNSQVLGGTGAVAIGEGQTVSGDGAVAIGDPNTVTGTGAVGMGANNTADGTGALAIGSANTATGQGSIALGNASNATGAGSLAFGDAASAGNAGDVALGSGSVTGAAVGTAGTTIAGTNYSFAGTAPTSTVSVGAPGAERTITNVAAGRLSGTSTDAVNGSQLFATNQAVDSIATTANAGWNLSADGGTTSQNIAPGGTASFAAGSNTTVSRTGSTITYGVVADPSFNSVTVGGTSITTDGLTIAGGPSITSTGINAGGRTITNVAPGVGGTDAVNVNQLNEIGDVANAGWNLQANGDTATKVAPGGTVQFLNGQNIAVTRTGTDITVATTPALTADSLTLTSGQVFDAAGLNMNGTGITGLAPGAVNSTSTDGINGSQLYGVSQSIATHLGGDSTVNPDGTITGPTYNVQGNNYTTVTDAFDAVDGNLTTINNQLTNINNGAGIKYFHANSTLADSQAVGTDSVAVGPTAVASVQDGIAIGHGAAAGANAGDVALGAGSTTAAAVATAGATIAGKDYSFAGATPTSTVSVGAPGAERTITNVAAGRLSADSTDAVNGSQLFATNSAVNVLGTQVGNGGIGPVQYSNPDSPTTPNGGTPTFDLTLVGEDSGPVKLHNVDKGVVSSTSTDAINGSQLFGTAQSITNVLGGGSTVNPDGTITGPTFLVQGSSYTTIYDAVGAVNDSLTNINNGGGIKYFHANSTLADSQAVGTNSVAIGPASIANGEDSFAAGNGATTAAGATGAVALGSSASAGASGATALGQGATATNANDVALGAGSKTAAAVGTSSASFNNFTLEGFAGTNPTSTVSVGDVGAERTITNVAAGQITSTSTDAINGSQLYSLASVVDNSINGGAGIKYFHANSTLADSAATGTNSTAIGPASTASASNAISMGNGASASANNAIAIGAGAQATKANSLALGAGSTTMANLSDAAYAPVVGATTAGVATGEVSVGSSGAERRITNVAAGSAATDGVNVSQLTALANVSVKYDTDGSGNLTNRITLQGGNPNAPVTIGNVAPGVNGTDAVNVDQLNGAFDSLNGKIKQARREAWQGAAIGIAASSLQFDTRPGKVSASMGGGMWREQGALALGLGYTAESGRVRVNARAVTSGDDWGGGIGVSFTFN